MATPSATAGGLFVLGIILGAGMVYAFASSNDSQPQTTTIVSTDASTVEETTTQISTLYSTSVRSVVQTVSSTVIQTSTTTFSTTTTVHSAFPFIQQPWPTIDQFGSNCVNGPTATYSQNITTSRPDALGIFIVIAHNYTPVNVTSPNLVWSGPLGLYADSTPNVYWASIPDPGNYVVNVNLPAADHFKLMWIDLTGAVTKGNPFDGSVQKSGPTQSDTFSASVLTSQKNDLVMGFFEQQGASGTANYTALSPFSSGVQADTACYSQTENIAVAPFSSPTNQTFDILQSTSANQWAGSTIGILSASP